MARLELFLSLLVPVRASAALAVPGAIHQQIPGCSQGLTAIHLNVLEWSLGRNNTINSENDQAHYAVWGGSSVLSLARTLYDRAMGLKREAMFGCE